MIKYQTIKILFLADTHLGFDLPMKPRIQRRRRGDDFFKNNSLALQPAFNHQVDLVIHGGDLFFRSRVHPKIVHDAFKPLVKLADSGIPVFIVPGNHERSTIPQSLLETHPMIHIFDKPRTFNYTIDKITLSLAGFPYYKNGIRKNFKEVIERTSFAERAEKKGYFIIEAGFFQNTNSPEIKWIFHELPARPMYVLKIMDQEIQSPNFLLLLKNKFANLNPNSIVQLKFNASFYDKSDHPISLQLLRSIAPATMNIEISATPNT